MVTNYTKTSLKMKYL